MLNQGPFSVLLFPQTGSSSFLPSPYLTAAHSCGPRLRAAKLDVFHYVELFLRICQIFFAPPPHWGGLDLKISKKFPRVLSRARRRGRKARRVCCRGTLRGKGYLAFGSPPSSFPRQCTRRSGRAPHRGGFFLWTRKFILPAFQNGLNCFIRLRWWSLAIF